MGSVTTRYRFDIPNDDWFIGEAPQGYDFIVARHGDYPAFRPNIGATTVALPEGQTLLGVMEESARSTATGAEQISVGEEAVNDDATVGRQTLSFAVDSPIGVLELTQYQVFYLLAAEQGTGEGDRVLCVVMSALSRDADTQYDDFDKFLESLRFEDD